MKIMLICAGGMSTGILMNKMNKSPDIEVKAFSADECKEHSQDYDVLLLAPQISYRENEIKNSVNRPVGIIKPLDYALGNVKEIIELAEKTIEGENNEKI